MAKLVFKHAQVARTEEEQLLNNCAHLDRGEYGRYIIYGTPLVLEDIQADASIIVDCSTLHISQAVLQVIHLCHSFQGDLLFG